MNTFSFNNLFMYLSICLFDRKQKRDGGDFISNLTNNISKYV